MDPSWPLKRSLWLTNRIFSSFFFGQTYHEFVICPVIFLTKFENIAEPSIRIWRVVHTEMLRHVVPVEPLPEVGEPDRVLDEDGVVLWPCYQGSLPPQDKVVVLHRTPGLYFTHRYCSILVRFVCRDTMTCLGTMTCIIIDRLMIVQLDWATQWNNIQAPPLKHVTIFMRAVNIKNYF